MPRPAVSPGRLLERIGDDAPRGMTVHDKTRLIGRLRHILVGCAQKNPKVCAANLGSHCALPYPASAAREPPPNLGGITSRFTASREQVQQTGNAVACALRIGGPSVLVTMRPEEFPSLLRNVFGLPRPPYRARGAPQPFTRIAAITVSGHFLIDQQSVTKTKFFPECAMDRLQHVLKQPLRSAALRFSEFGQNLEI